MKLRKLYETTSTRIQEIEPFSEHPSTTITVSQRQELLTDRWKPTEILWPGRGAQNSQETFEFADALKFATELAKQWDAERVK
jgi:hypothetical protein